MTKGDVPVWLRFVVSYYHCVWLIWLVGGLAKMCPMPNAHVMLIPI